MKKCATFLLAVLYLVFATGATLHAHYCMGDFVAYSLQDTSDGACSKCGMENHESSKDCCKDISKTVKISDSHSPTAHTGLPAVPVESLPATPFVMPLLSRGGNSVAVASAPDTGPPGLSALPLYLQIRTLRI